MRAPLLTAVSALAHTLARTAFGTGELPLVLGAPLFLLMLRRRFTTVH